MSSKYVEEGIFLTFNNLMVSTIVFVFPVPGGYNSRQSIIKTGLGLEHTP